MASNDNSRGKLLTAGGILSIVAGIFHINNGAMLMASFLTHVRVYEIMPFEGMIPFLPGLWVDLWQFSNFTDGSPIRATIGVLFLVLGILAVIGGISAVRRKSFGLSLAGAICALASGLLGILAVIFVALGKRELRAEE
jgi:uncharacterized membrane protein HdeD (DUF308 family)